MQALLINYLYNEVLLSVVILALLLLSVLLYKKYTARGRYYTWLIVLIALMIPYRVPIQKVPWQIDITSIVQQFTQNGGKQSGTLLHTFSKEGPAASVNYVDSDHVSDTLPRTMNRNFSIVDYLMITWLSGIIISIGFMIATHRHFIAYSRKWYESVIDIEKKTIIDELQKKYEVEVQVKQCKLLNTPITIGLVHPMILLPCTEFDEQELNLLVSHEMLHCKRKDIWYKLFINLVIAVHWYNPIVYVMKNRIYLECEASCDEEVLAGHDEDTRLKYGEIMIDLIRHQNMKISPLTSAFFLEKRKIKERLFNIMNSHLKQNGARAMGAITLIAVLAVNLLGFSYNQLPETVPENDMKQSSNIEIPQENRQQRSQPKVPQETIQTSTINGGIAPNLTENIGMLDMKKGEKITFSLQQKISDPMGHVLSESITILIVDKGHHISSLQINNQSVSSTFTAPEEDNYLIAIQNASQQLLNYNIEYSTTSQSEMAAPSGDQQLTASLPADSSQTIKNNASGNINKNQQDQGQKKVTAVTNDDTAKAYYKRTGSVNDILGHLDEVSQNTLDSILTDYIKKTNDIGTLFVAVDYLSQETIDTITVDYIKRTNDIGMVFSAMPYLSQAAIDKIAKNYASSNSDPGMIEALKPYVSQGIL